MKPVIEYHENGRKKLKYYLVNGVKNRKETCWYKNGKKYEEGCYVNDKKNGVWTSWHENGRKNTETNYVNGKREGKETWRYENNGKISDEIIYVNDKAVIWSFYDIHGQKTCDGCYIQHRIDIIRYRSYMNERKECEGLRVKHKLEGIWTHWDESEHIHEINIWANDLKIISFST
jgi:antitoxin component YwqK of YwqJK toxin-antitoxin module